MITGVSRHSQRRIETIQRSVGPRWGSLSSESSHLPHFKRSNSNLVYFIIWGEKNIWESKVWETAVWVWCSDLQMDVWKAQKGHGICWKSSVVISELRLESGTQCSASPLPGQSWEGKRWCTHIVPENATVTPNLSNMLHVEDPETRPPLGSWLSA